MKRPIIIALTVTCAITTGLLLSKSSWETLQTQRQAYNEKIQASRKIETDRAELLKKTAQLDSPFGKEQRARELGYRKPYEKPLTLD